MAIMWVGLIFCFLLPLFSTVLMFLESGPILFTFTEPITWLTLEYNFGIQRKLEKKIQKQMSVRLEYYFILYINIYLLLLDFSWGIRSDVEQAIGHKPRVPSCMRALHVSVNDTNTQAKSGEIVSKNI